MDNQNQEKVIKTPENVRKSISKYQKNNKEKMQQKCKNYYERLKKDPERYAKYLKRHRDYRAGKKAEKISNLENENPV